MNKTIWGVLGGMGPLASAEFMSTIYQKNTTGAEQECPVVMLISDPTFPDRTEALLQDNTKALLEQFSGRMEQLAGLGATRIVICCVTIHPLLRCLAPALRMKAVSLVDVIFDRVLRSQQQQHLLLCTQGARTIGLFQQHQAWPMASDRIILPSEHDQEGIHEWIYEVKRNLRLAGRQDWLQALLRKYSATSYIAGCTELHIVAREQERQTGQDAREFCIDPLTDIAAMMWEDLTSFKAHQNTGVKCQLQP